MIGDHLPGYDKPIKDSINFLNAGHSLGNRL